MYQSFFLLYNAFSVFFQTACLRFGLTGRVAGLTHERTAFVFLCGRCQSCGVRSPSCSESVASCARCQSRCAQSPRREESRVIASSVVSRRLSPRREESRVIASSVVSRRLSSRCASSSCSVSVASCAESCRCQSRLVVRRPAARRQSRRVRSPAASSCQSQSPFFLFQTRWMTFFFVLY